MADGEWFCRISGREREALRGVGVDALALYMVLRFQIDFSTGIVGRRTPISWDGLAWELRSEVTRGRGMQIVRPTLQVMRGAVGRLVSRGLLRRIGGDDCLCFLCPLVDVAPVCKNQTQQSDNRQQYTEHNSDKNKKNNELDVVGNSRERNAVGLYPTDIIDVRMYTYQSSSTAGRFDASGDDGAGVNRDRPAGSQAGSLGRPGKTHEGSDRDRPTASHPAPGRRLISRADAGVPDPDGHEPDSVRSSAKKDALAEGSSAADAAPGAVGLLRAVLNARGIRCEEGAVVLDRWAADGVGVDELAAAVEKARAARLAADSTQPIPLLYVARVVQSNRAAAKRALARMDGLSPRPGRGGLGDLRALAVVLGVEARPGESWEGFQSRVRAARDARNAAASEGAL